MLCFTLHPNEASILLFKGNKARLGALGYLVGIGSETHPQVMELILWHGMSREGHHYLLFV